jgi:hypothetical protein
MSDHMDNSGWDGGTPDVLPAPTPAPREAESGNVDKIRDILFGAQMRDYDRRFSGLEERLLQEAAALREEVAQRLGATEQFVRGELDALTARLSAEQRDRTQAVRETTDALTNVNRELSERIAALAEQTAQHHRELRQAMSEQQRALTDEGSRRHQELTAAMRREGNDLRNAKIDRTALAGMFAELAHRLSNEGDGR